MTSTSMMAVRFGKLSNMHALKAKVVNGRFVIDEPTELPEGTELYLVPVSEEDEDRLDVEEANKVLAEMKATGEQSIPLSEIKAQFGL
jgi:hypothetical protein